MKLLRIFYKFITITYLYISNKMNSNPKLETRVLNTAILNFAPSLKLHHIVLLSNKKNNIYTLDFSPINQSHSSTLLKLLFGRNVPAEIRVRHLHNINFYDDNNIINIWCSLNNVSYIESQKLSDNTIKKINKFTDYNLYKLIYYISKSNNTMNLYNYNCQHFSSCVLKSINSSYMI